MIIIVHTSDRYVLNASCVLGTGLLASTVESKADMASAFQELVALWT